MVPAAGLCALSKGCGEGGDREGGVFGAPLATAFWSSWVAEAAHITDDSHVQCLLRMACCAGAGAGADPGWCTAAWILQVPSAAQGHHTDRTASAGKYAYTRMRRDTDSLAQSDTVAAALSASST